MLTLTGQETLAEILVWLREVSGAKAPGEIIELRAPDPDLGAGLHSGEPITCNGSHWRHRSHRTWLDLAERLGLRYLTPRVLGDGLLDLRFQVLDPGADWHEQRVDDVTEKYGVASPFARIDKLEEPCFLIDLIAALERIGLQPGARVLDLGCNDGAVFAAFDQVYPGASLQFTGVDHSASAIERAQNRFPTANFRFICHDLGKLFALTLPPQDLILSIGTLQSPGFDGKDLLLQVRKRLLTPSGAFLLGFPNVRYLDGELRQGARTRNYRESELSLLIKDLFFYRRYFQQHGFQVTLTGKYYLFLTAWRRMEDKPEA
jgi:SAM-dependent methyltransferase